MDSDIRGNRFPINIINKVTGLNRNGEVKEVITATPWPHFRTSLLALTVEFLVFHAFLFSVVFFTSSDDDVYTSKVLNIILLCTCFYMRKLQIQLCSNVIMCTANNEKFLISKISKTNFLSPNFMSPH